MRKRRLWLMVAVVALAAGLLPSPALAGGHGFQTSDPALLTPIVGGAKVTPIISVGDTVDGVMFEGIPDGVGLAPDDDGDPQSKGRRGQRPATVDVYVSHEQSTVPFRSARDFTDASITRWTLDTRTGRVLSAEVSIPASDGFLRFCSSYMGTPADGFDTHVFFANEETNDIVPVPAGAPYGADPATAPDRQGGYAVALDTATGDYAVIPGMGRHNHENTVAVPGYDELVLLSGDDTFTATTSQLYLYTADDQDAMFADEGTLYAFRVTHKNGAAVVATAPFNGANDYLDLGVDDVMQGEFIEVPEAIAKGTTADPPQKALEDWSIANNVFTFIRLEDIAVDRNDPRVVYVADTGASRVVPNPATGRIHRPGGATGLADNGRIFAFTFNDADPLVVDSFTVFADGDAPASHPKFVGFESPDNIDTSRKSLMVQEDADEAQIWQHRFSDGTWRPVANVVDTGGESSGIVDASTWFGPGHWLVTIQAHDLPFVDVDTTTEPGITIKREEGQLVLLKVPGS